MPEATSPRKAYVIQMVSWEYNDEWHDRDGNDRPVRAYSNRARATQELRKRERKERARWEAGGPFNFGAGLAEVTSLSEDELLQQLQQMGIAAPQLRGGQREWWGWWEPLTQRLESDQLEALWALFDKVRFFELVKVDV